MIVSHKHRFIFIKTHKTAGTSVEISLSRYCGPEDIITPISAEDGAVRTELGEGPRNYDGPLWKYRARDVARLLSPRRRALFFNHMPAHRVRQLVGRAIWEKYYTFCIERNPWDKLVSAFHWGQRHEGGPTSFSDYLAQGRRLDVRDFPLYTIRGKVAVDRVGRFETLQDDLSLVCGQVGIDFDGWLPRAKSRFRSRERTYQQHYSPAERDLVARWFRREIDLFGYQF